MKDNEYRYSAFISYRHCDLDKYVAEHLHKLIETYIMPKPVVNKYNITDNNFRRVFRDEEELPLSSNLEEPIIDALKHSKFLIVICSPRLKESIWCKKEIENFIEYHGRKNILCVLVEGEPKDSFPDILQYYEVKTKTKDGKEKVKKVECEPLAMDVRGKNRKEINKRLKEELIRIIAPMYELNYDDIKQRHEERKIRRKRRIIEIVIAILIIFSIYSGYLFLKIYNSSNKLKYDQSINLANDANRALLNDDRNEAVEKAYQSISEYNGIKMPITAKGLYELTDSLGLYYLKYYFYPSSELNTLGIVNNMKTNKEGKYLLSYDSSGELVLWDLDKEKRIITIDDIKTYASENSYSFIDNNRFAYINNKKEVVLLNIKGKIINRISLDISPLNITSSNNGKYLEIDDSKKGYIYDTNNSKELSSFIISNDLVINNKRYFDFKDECFIFATFDKNKLYSDYLELNIYNLKDKKINNNIKLEADTLKKIVFHHNDVILLAQKKVDKATKMIVVSYNYKSGKVNFKKDYDKEYAVDLSMNINDKDNKTVLVIGENMSYLLDYDTGKTRRQISMNNSERNVFELTDGNFALFSSDGDINLIDIREDAYNDVDKNIKYNNLLNCNLSDYQEFLKTWIGYLTYTNNDNRIIIYSQLDNKEIKKIDYKTKENNKLNIKERNELVLKYNNKKKNLVSSVFYSSDKLLLFIVYKDSKMEIYNTKSKELIKELEIPHNASFLDTYVTKTNNGEHIIKGIGGYILNKDLDLIAYIPNLYDYKDNKLILLDSSNKKFYEVKKYNDKEVIKKAKEYLEAKGLK